MDVQKVLADYVNDVTTAELAAESTLVHEHLARVVEAAGTRDFVDLKLAKAIGDVLLALLEDVADYTARERALLSGAIRYFSEHNDVTGDLTNPTGFEDDAEILNAVCTFLGRAELSVESE